MAHGIEKPIDKIFSTAGTEWHGLADKVDKITLEHAREFFYPIRTGKIVVEIDGQNVPMSHHKALVADFRKCRPDLAGTENELVPLHIPRQTYTEFENERVYELMEQAVKEIDAKITVIGTIHAAKKFWLSVSSPDSVLKVNGEKIAANIIALTSHDGTMGLNFYDSCIRPVCMNTIRGSLGMKGAISEKIFHSANMQTAVDNLAESMRNILAGRAEFEIMLNELAGISISHLNARKLIAGYFALTTGADEFHTKTLNAIDEIHSLFLAGKGNQGKTLWDVLNGATEYYTHGSGTGKTGTPASRAYKAAFGGAADHKTAFVAMLSDGEKRAEMIEAGARVLANTANE